MQERELGLTPQRIEFQRQSRKGLLNFSGTGYREDIEAILRIGMSDEYTVSDSMLFHTLLQPLMRCYDANERIEIQKLDFAPLIIDQVITLNSSSLPELTNNEIAYYRYRLSRQPTRPQLDTLDEGTIKTIHLLE